MNKELKKFLIKNGYGSQNWQGERYVHHDDVFCDEDGGYLPCYITRIVVKDTIDTIEKVHKFIELTSKECRKGILMFSVTEKDKNNKVFREAMDEYEGVTITECVSRWHGDYKCWMISLPVF